MNKLFSFSLYKEGLKRVRGAGVASVVIFAVFNFLPVLACFVGAGLFGTYPINLDGVKNLPISATYAMLFSRYIMVFLAPVIVMRMFSFLYKRSSSDFFHAIPQKRICLFLSFFAAALTWVAGTVILSGIVNFIGWNLLENYSVNILVMARCVFSGIVLGALCASCMALAVGFTGNAFSGIFACISILGLPALTINALGGFVSAINASFCFDRSFFQYTSTKGFLLIASNSDFHNPISLAIILAIIVSVLLTVFASIAFVRRKSETAGNSTSNSFIQHVLRCCATLPLFLVITWMIIEGEALLSVVFLPITAVIYVLYELITTRRLKNVLKSLPVYFAVPAVCLALVLGAFAYSGAVELATPKNLEDIKYVELDELGYIYLDGISSDKIADVQFEDPEIIRYATNDFRYTEDTGYCYNTVKLKMKNGATVWRNVHYSEESQKKLREALFANEECKNALLSLPEYSELIETNDVTEEIWNAFVKEYSKLSDSEKREVFSGSNYSAYSFTITVVYNARNGNRIYEQYYLSSKDFSETFELYKEQGYSDIYGESYDDKEITEEKVF